MADIRQLYIDVLKDYDPYEYFEEQEQIESDLSLNTMLYNLICIVTLNFQDCTKEELKHDAIYNRMNTLINLLTILGGKPVLY